MSKPEYRILFLDIDGVLNSHQSIIWCNRLGIPNGGLTPTLDKAKLCPISVSNLLHVLEEIPDLRICVSSAWRRGESLESMQNLLFHLADIPQSRVVGLTPRMHRPRGLEIQAWIDSVKDQMTVKDFVIVDDSSDMEHLLPYLIQTDEREGFMLGKALETLDHLTYPWTRCAPYELMEWQGAYETEMIEVSDFERHYRLTLNGSARFRTTKVPSPLDPENYEIQYWKLQDERKLNQHPKATKDS